VSPRIKPSRRFPLDAAEETYKRIIAVLVKKVILRHSIASATSNDVPGLFDVSRPVAASFIVATKTIGATSPAGLRD